MTRRTVTNIMTGGMTSAQGSVFPCYILAGTPRRQHLPIGVHCTGRRAASQLRSISLSRREPGILL